MSGRADVVARLGDHRRLTAGISTVSVLAERPFASLADFQPAQSTRSVLPGRVRGISRLNPATAGLSGTGGVFAPTR